LRPTFRFAPSPNGRLHLGHAYSALCNERVAKAADGLLRLRIEDTDPTRSKRAFEVAIVTDLAWLGVAFDGEMRRQSDHLGDYDQAFRDLGERGLTYPCFCTRGRILERGGGARDPDGAPLHLGPCVDEETEARLARGETPGWRLDAQRAMAEVRVPLFWREYGEGDVAHLVEADPLAWGDVLLRSRERAATYHLAVVVDDTIQSVTDVVRGRDLYAATSIHLLLQSLLGLPTPSYRHHRLVMDETNAKMSKSLHSQPLSALRERGFCADDIRAALGFGGTARNPIAAVLS
jgi:glutamyl-Q tRNA(Asp) synthetase